MTPDPMARQVNFSTRALRDLRRIGPGPESQRIAGGLNALGRGDENLDVRAVEGKPG
jgi:hypothetical protein